MPSPDATYLHIVSTHWGFVLVFPTEASLSGAIDHLTGMLVAKRAEIVPAGRKNYAAYLVATDSVPTEGEMQNLLERVVGGTNEP